MRAFTPEQTAQRSAASPVLADAMTELPLALREVSISRELEELWCKEVARVADGPIGAMLSCLVRARDVRQRSPLLFDDRYFLAFGRKCNAMAMGTYLALDYFAGS